MLDFALQSLALICRCRNALRNRSSEAAAIFRSRLEFYEHVWRHAAAQVGAEIRPIGADVFEVTKGARQTRVFMNYGPLDNSVTLRLARNKPAVYRILADAGLPVPKHSVIDGLNISAAVEFFNAAKKPIVVKPAFGTGAGSGVTTHISSKTCLARAVALSKALCPETLVEEQVARCDFRLLYLDGEILDCIERRPPSVTGDGKSTLRQLVEKENEFRLNAGIGMAQALLPIDEDMKNTLSAKNLSLRSVPQNGESIDVKCVINGNRGADNIAAMKRVSPDLIRIGRDIVKLIGIRLAGVDIITSDQTQNLGDTGGAIVDVNTIPSLYVHQWNTDGGFAAAIAVLRRALDERGLQTYAAE